CVVTGGEVVGPAGHAACNAGELFRGEGAPGGVGVEDYAVRVEDRDVVRQRVDRRAGELLLAQQLRLRRLALAQVAVDDPVADQQDRQVRGRQGRKGDGGGAEKAPVVARRRLAAGPAGQHVHRAL